MSFNRDTILRILPILAIILATLSASAQSGNAGLVRQIWGAAIDVSSDGQYSADPSHPAFYLPGQEPQTGNFRPVAALDP